MRTKSQLTLLLAGDHLTDNFAKLIRRIDTAMNYMPLNEVMENLRDEGYASLDIYFACAAAKIRHAGPGEVFEQATADSTEVD